MSATHLPETFPQHHCFFCRPPFPIPQTNAGIRAFGKEELRSCTQDEGWMQYTDAQTLGQAPMCTERILLRTIF